VGLELPNSAQKNPGYKGTGKECGRADKGTFAWSLATTLSKHKATGSESITNRAADSVSSAEVDKIKPRPFVRKRHSRTKTPALSFRTGTV